MGLGYLLRESSVPKPVKYNKQGANCLEVGSDYDLLATEETYSRLIPHLHINHLALPDHVSQIHLSDLNFLLILITPPPHHNPTPSPTTQCVRTFLVTVRRPDVGYLICLKQP